MPRRCLDCDTVRADGAACPRCGGTQALFIDAAGGGDERYDASAWMILTHAVAAACATWGLRPADALGSAWFLQGCWAVLLLFHMDWSPRGARIVIGLSVLVHAVYAVTTPQRLFALLSVALLLAAVVRMITDQTRWFVRLALPVGICLAVAFVALTSAARLGWSAPGWWEGLHPKLNWQKIQQR